MLTETELTTAIGTSDIKAQEIEKQEIDIQTEMKSTNDEPIAILLDSDQHSMDGNDPDWNYNIRALGNIVKYQVPKLKGDNQNEFEVYWFAMEDATWEKIVNDKEPIDTKETKKKKIPPNYRKVFVSGKVSRLSDIDPNEETFRCKFYFYFNWLLTKAEYLDYCEHKYNNSIDEFKPQWFPQFELQNCIQQDEYEFQEYPNQGPFRVQMLKGFGSKYGLDSWGDIGRNPFCRAKLQISGVFSEELELQNFPFDCQPLNIYLHERTGGSRCIFLPELRKTNFFALDPRYSVISEWDLLTFVLAFGDADTYASRSRSSYAMINIKISVARRWTIYIYRSFLVIAVINLLGLCGFVIFDATERLNMLLALLLTIVFAMQESLSESYMTFLGRYSLCGFIFLVLLTAQATFYDYYDSDMDVIFLYCFSVLFLIMQLIWILLAYIARKDELLRCTYSVDEEEKETNLSKPGLRADYTKWIRQGINGRLLSFEGYTHASAFLTEKQKGILEKKKQKLDELYSSV